MDCLFVFFCLSGKLESVMLANSHNFKSNVRYALKDQSLQDALGQLKTGFIERRRMAAACLPEFEALRDQARDIKNHTLEHLDFYLEAYEAKVVESGGHVHWCRDAAEARAKILELCHALKARTVTKGKSMITEEIALNEHLAANGIEPVETDLGEYIIQLRQEAPSHLIAPAVHVSRQQVEETFRKTHTELEPDRVLTEGSMLLAEARMMLRDRFLAADVGITGANFLISETGSSVIVTNEGNGDLTQILPRAHIVVASLEKIVPTLEDVSTLLRVLARSATGQEMSVYTTFSTGPRRAEDTDGPEAYHVILLDNGRSAMLGSEFQEMLRCIRCGACLNHCPVYGAIGGHAYGWVYPGPMGSVLTPSLIGINESGHLPNASTFCGRCESVCPVHIPLPRMMRHWRAREFQMHGAPLWTRKGAARLIVRVWARLARHPWLYHQMTGLVAKVLGWRKTGRYRFMPFANSWTRHRDLPAPQGASFHQLYMRSAAHKHRKSKL